MKNHFKDKTESELNDALREKREEVRALRFGTGVRSRDAFAQRKARRAVAQILTQKDLIERSKNVA